MIAIDTSSSHWNAHDVMLELKWVAESGVMGWMVEIGAGSRSRIEAIRLALLFPSKARLPVVIS
jgi:hypothetical protein